MEDFDEQDVGLAALFGTVAAPQADGDFTDGVMGRIRRRRLARQLVLSGAAFAGLMITLLLWNGAAILTAFGSIAVGAAPWTDLASSISVTLILASTVVSCFMVGLLTE